MITDFTAQALLAEARYLDSKPVEAHNMRSFVCGSTSCAIGDMMIRQGLFPNRQTEVIGQEELNEYSLSLSEVGKDIIWPTGGFDYVAVELGMSYEEAYFLFNLTHLVLASISSSASVLSQSYVVRDRAYETPAQTAARLRKYVYYKLRKREIFRDYERARRQEGDWNVASHAKVCAMNEVTA